MNIRSYLRFLDRLVVKKKRMPIYTVLFVTARCTCRCKHCLLGQGLIKDTRELSLDQYEKIARSMGPLLFLLPTGGEPFLRRDLPDIVSLFVKHTRVPNVGIPTNGTLTDQVITSTERMLKEHPTLDLAVDVSLDGIGPLHDEIRGTRAFDKAVATFKELKKLAARFPRFNANIGLTVSAYNEDHLRETYRYLRDTLGVKTINHLLVRGSPRDELAKEVNMEKYLDFSRFLDQEVRQGRLQGYHGFPFANLVNSIRSVRPQVIYDRVRREKPLVPCLAARLGVVILSNGLVYPCELLEKPLGDLNTNDFNFRKVWFSPQARAVRRWIKENKCWCTYECFLTLSIFFSFRGLGRVLSHYISRYLLPAGIGKSDLQDGGVARKETGHKPLNQPQDP